MAGRLIPSLDDIAGRILPLIQEKIETAYLAGGVTGFLLGLAVASLLLWVSELVARRSSSDEERSIMNLRNALILLFAGILAVLGCKADQRGNPKKPCDCPKVKPACLNILDMAPRRPQVYAQSVGATVGRTAPDGTEPLCDLPAPLHTRNTASKGLGNCVFTSIHHSAHWQEVPQLQGFAQWLTQKGIPGGGYPSKVAKLIPEICRDRGMPEPRWIQIQGKDLDLLRLACKTGRMPAITYSRSPTGRYNGRSIAHMVSLPHADAKWFGILDNNYPGPDKIEWLTEQEFLKVGPDWAVILLEPGPPPIPRNADATPNLIRVRDQGPICSDLGLPIYRWERGSDADNWNLYLNGKQIGNRYRGRYRPLVSDGKLGEPCEPPLLNPNDPPKVTLLKPKEEDDCPELHDCQGVELDKIAHGEHPVYLLNGVEVEREQIVQALVEGRDELKDDSELARITVISNDKLERDRVLADLENSPALSFCKGKVVVKAYPANHWAVTSVGFDTNGKPGIYFQAPAGWQVSGKLTQGGEVLHYQGDYDGGPDMLAQAIRKADPAYRNDRNPDRRKPDVKPVGPDDPNQPAQPHSKGPICVVCGLGLAAVARYLYSLKK